MFDLYTVYKCIKQVASKKLNFFREISRDKCSRLYKGIGPMKTKPIPTRFEMAEGRFLSRAKKATGLSRSDLLRRAVMLMARQHRALRDFDFILKLHQ